MNVLIRSIDKDTKWNEVVGILALLTTQDEFIEKLDLMKELVFSDKRLNLTRPIIITKQGNGNICVEFGTTNE